MKNISRNIKNLHWLWLSVSVFLIDQVTKMWIVRHFNFHEVKAITSFFNLTLTYNSGAAFGFLRHAGGWQRILFSGIAVVVSISIVIWLYRLSIKDKWTACSLSLILGGALGNLWDRVFLGHVVDFLDFYVKHWHFATFNVADISVSVGAGLLLLSAFLAEKS